MIGNLETWASEAAARARQHGVAEIVKIEVRMPEHPGSGHVVNFDGERVIGQFIVWPSGATEASAVEIATEERFYFSEAVAAEVKALDDLFDVFVRALASVELESS